MKSTLRLETEFSYGKTNIKDIYFEAPYKIMSPFQQGGRTEVMQMCASAGMLSGDVFDLSLQVGPNCDLTYTSQSYEKIFAAQGELTVKRTEIQVAEGASLCYLPYPMIPFAESDFYGENRIDIRPDSRLVYGDIFNCGRVAMGEQFRMKRFRSKTKIYMGAKLAFADHTLLMPQQFRHNSFGLWGDYTHNGLLYLYPGDPKQEEAWLQRIRSSCPDTLEAGCTRAREGIVLRVLGTSGEEIYAYFRKIAHLLNGLAAGSL